MGQQSTNPHFKGEGMSTIRENDAAKIQVLEQAIQQPQTIQQPPNQNYRKSFKPLQNAGS